MKKSSVAVFALILSGAMLFSYHPVLAQNSGAQASTSQTNQSSLDQDIDLLRKDIRSQKKQLIAANVPLTDAEAEKFWPIYDQYTSELVQINNEKYQMLKEYAQNNGSMTDAQAADWTPRLLKLDSNVAALRLKYWPKISSVLPPKKAALYEQVERQAQLLIDVQIATQVPLVQP